MLFGAYRNHTTELHGNCKFLVCMLLVVSIRGEKIIRPTQPPSYPLFYFYRKLFSQVQAIVPGFRLSKLHASVKSSLELVSLYKRHRKHDHTLHNKPA